MIQDSKSNKVTERYFSSEFVGHAAAADKLTHLKNGMALLNPCNMVQISIDDPNVKWKFYHNLTLSLSQSQSQLHYHNQHKGEELPDLLNIFSSSFNIYWKL